MRVGNQGKTRLSGVHAQIVHGARVCWRCGAAVISREGDGEGGGKEKKRNAGEKGERDMLSDKMKARQKY